jgi:nucleotide-binding universal stress UspA family protein
MYQRILVPLDGSAFAEEVLPYALGIRDATGAGVTLLRVTHKNEGRAYAAKYVQGLANDLGLSAKTRVDEDIANAILAEAAEDPQALLCMTTHGRTGFQEALMGSAAYSVMRASRRPVILHRPRGGYRSREPVKVNSVVLALDGSELAETMEREAADAARWLGAELLVVQAIPVEARAGTGVPAGDVIESSYVHSRASRLERDCGITAQWEVLRGDAAEAISRFVEGRRDVLLAMSSRGRGGLQRALFGSVASECLRRCGAPLLIKVSA